MASHDVRDVLNLPADGAARPTKKAKIAAPRTNLKGLAREVQNLGGDNPIALVPEISSFKKRRFGSRKPAAKWEMRGFKNSARDDGSLILKHWRRQTERPTPSQGAQPDQPMENEDVEQPQPPQDELEDSTFAKFNVKVSIPQYNDDQYSSNLQNDNWTKEETSYLMELASQFDLRWPLIWDRYEYVPKAPDAQAENADGVNSNTAMIVSPKERTMEDLKARYYDVAAKMMAVQKPVQYMTQPEFSLHETMTNFNPAQETARKNFAQNALSRSREEVREEELLLMEVRRILARTERFNQERRELYNRLDYPHTDQDISAFKSSAGLQTLLQNLMNVDKSKKQRKSIMASDGVSTPASAGPAGPHASSTPAQENRRESIAASTGHRDSIGGSEKPETASKPSKKGAPPAERRKLTETEEALYGVSHHDRLPSGPTFRYDRINKILTMKSNVQHTRIINTLGELDIPTRLNMPTGNVVAQMEKLLSSIMVLLEQRKVNDKIDSEIKVELAKKAERDKTLNPTKEEVKKEGDGAEGQKNDSLNTASAQDESKKDEQTPAAQSASEQVDGESQPTALAPDGDATEKAAEGAKADSGKADQAKIEAAEDQETRPQSSGGGPHKRSASVLSAVSDKSAKRQKK